MIGTLSRLAAQWKTQRMRRRTELVIGDLSPELRRDIGFPAVDVFPDGKSRFPRR